MILSVHYLIALAFSKLPSPWEQGHFLRASIIEAINKTNRLRHSLSPQRGFAITLLTTLISFP